MSLKLHTPTVEGGQALFAVAVYECHLCQGNMVVASKERHWRDHSVWPYYVRLTFEAQAKRAGLHFVSSARVYDRAICTKCSDAGRADFLCALCGKRHPTDQIQESFGDPPEHLCCGCYDSVSAKCWDEKVAALRESHRWDYE